MANIKIIGLGNGFRGDDAIGNVVARELHHYENPTTSIIEGGLAGVHLIQEMEGTDTLILIDAVSSQSPPGTIHRLRLPQDLGKIRLLAWNPSGASTHDVGLGEALTLAETLGVLPPHMVIYGIEIGTIQTGAPLSPPVAQAIQTVVNRIVTEELHPAHA
jgi:hydrogenase maturation protease